MQNKYPIDLEDASEQQMDSQEEWTEEEWMDQEYDPCMEDPEYDDSMDGDFDSAMASAGFGTDEDYGSYGDEY
jgi:hypothetical protein